MFEKSVERGKGVRIKEISHSPPYSPGYPCG
jgi:hypothetical protein